MSFLWGGVLRKLWLGFNNLSYYRVGVTEAIAASILSRSSQFFAYPPDGNCRVAPLMWF